MMIIMISKTPPRMDVKEDAYVRARVLLTPWRPPLQTSNNYMFYVGTWAE